MRQRIRNLGIRKRSDLDLMEISRVCEPILRGWEQYYGKYNKSSLNPIYQHFNRTLRTWAMRKYKKLRGRKIAASEFLKGIAEIRPQLFNHWIRGLVGFAWWERCESRGSCPVLREAWGVIPLAYSLAGLDFPTSIRLVINHFYIASQHNR